jgi:hypothetical protein
VSDAPTVGYFGCLERAGHFWHGPVKFWEHDPPLGLPEEIVRRIDQGYCPEGSQDEGRALLTVESGWTILAFWDRSVDGRGGSHSTFVCKGEHDFDTMVAMSRKQWPTVWERFKFEVWQ